ncbi:MAG: hypothetical protein M3376_14500 [Actinomycetota bacterium]|nr:hypothetical protein [Actinomycetota bacterium]
MNRIVVVLAILALSLAPAGLAQAQLGGPSVPTPLTEPPPPPPVENDLDDGGLSGLQQLLIFGAAALVLGVIGFVIVRDARRAAPVGNRSYKGGAAGSPGPGAKNRGGVGAPPTTISELRARERQQAKRAKAKAKAARHQRKRNRPK